MARRSPCGFSPKFASYVIWAYLSQSDEKTHWAPADSKANRIPPIPQNKSINLGEFTLSHRTCKPKITQLGANVSGVLLRVSMCSQCGSSHCSVSNWLESGGCRQIDCI